MYTYLNCIKTIMFTNYVTLFFGISDAKWLKPLTLETGVICESKSSFLIAYSYELHINCGHPFTWTTKKILSKRQVNYIFILIYLLNTQEDVYTSRVRNNSK